MKKITSLFCLLIVSILSNAVNEAEIKAIIEANSDVEVEIKNDSENPWVIRGIDTLYNPIAGSTITIVFKTDYITELTYTSKSSPSIYVDGSKSSPSTYVDGNTIYRRIYIPAGKHEIGIESTFSDAQVIRLSIKKICTNEDIKNMIQAASNVEIIDVINDSIYPLIIAGQDSIEATGSSELTIKYSSDKMTEISWAKYENNGYYNDVFRVYLDGVELGTPHPRSQKYHYHYLPAGEHVATFVFGNKSQFLVDFSIQEIEGKDPVKLYWDANSSGDSWQLVYPKHYYSYDRDSILKPSTGSRLFDIDYFGGCINGKTGFPFGNFNNDEYVDSIGGESLDFNNDGYPDFVELSTNNKKHDRIVRTIYNDGEVRSLVNLYSLDDYIEKIAKEEQQAESSIRSNARTLAYLCFPASEKVDTIVVESGSSGMSKPQRAIRQDISKALVGMGVSSGRDFRNLKTSKSAQCPMDRLLDINGDGIVEYVVSSVTLEHLPNGETVGASVAKVAFYNMGDGDIVYQIVPDDFVDLDADGVMDIIGFDGKSVVYYLLQQDGSYKKHSFGVDVLYTDFWCYDFDKDGDKDILLAFAYREEWGGSYMMMLENIGNDEYQSEEYFYEDKLYKPWCGDYDNDGNYEVIWVVDTKESTDYSDKYVAENICHIEVSGITLAERPIFWDIENFNFTYTNHYNIIDTDNDGVLEMWGTHSNQLVWKMNLADTPNTRPNKPQKPNVVYDYTTEMVSISWDLGSDVETSPVDLTYALRIGSEPGQGDILYAHAYADGTRRNMIGGNMYTNRLRVLNTKTWKSGKYYVSVQTIDPNNRGSEFSEEVVFEKTSHAKEFELMYNTEHFGVGDTCNVLLNPNVWLDTAAYVACTGGEVVGISADSLTLYVVFSKDGEQTISLRRRNANGSISTSCVKTIDVSPFHFTISKTKDTRVALDLNEDGFMEFYGIYEGESATTTHFHTYKDDGSISRVNKMFNNNTFWDDSYGPFMTLDINKDGRVDVFSNAGKSYNYSIFHALNSGNLSMTIYSDEENIISRKPNFDMNNDGWFEQVVSSYIYIADSAYTSFRQISCPQHGYFEPKDYTNDGLLDLIGLVDSKYYVLYENNGDFTYTTKDTLCSKTDLEDGSLYLISDFDNDGSVDIVYGHYGSDKSIVDNTTRILWGDGTRTIMEGITEAQNYPSGSSYEPADYGVFDYNNDGYLDMLAQTYGSEGYTYGVLLMLPNHEYKFVPTGYKFHTMEQNSKPYLTSEGNLLFTQTTYNGNASSNYVPNELILKSVNQRPAAPTNITATQNSKGVMITWDHSVDSETPAVRMRYNISVKHKGKSGDGAYLISPCNSTKNGVHVPSHLPLIEGNRFMIPMASIPVGEYEVQVQGVDLHYLESDFSEVFNLIVRETIEIEVPASTGVGVKTTITIASNIYDEGDILSEINLDGGVIDTVESKGHNLVIIWDTPGLKTITLSNYSHTINVKPMIDASFSIPAEVMQSATVNCSAKNARMGNWTILANGTKDSVLLRESEDVEIVLIDTANIVLRFGEVGTYVISHVVSSEFGEVVYRDTVQVTDKDIAPEILSVTNEGEHYQILWNSSTTLPEEVIGFRVYKETSAADVYDLVAELGIESRSYVDLSSNANIQTARYALSYITSYGESMRGTPHQGLHVMINRGMGNSWNLAWMKYEGRDVATYRIWRGTSPENLSVIGEISGNMTSYSDLMTSDSVCYYATEVVFKEETPSLMPARYGQKRSVESTTMSNIVSTASSHEVLFASSIELTGEGIVAGKNISSQLNAYIYPYYASYNAVNWMIESGEDIATISSSGKLNANGYANGNVVVRAYALDGSGVYGEITIKVSGFDDLFSITYMIDDEIIKSEELSYGSTIIPPSSTKEGYNIVWYNLPATMPAKDIVVNGEYVLNSYLLTYMVDGEVYDVDTVLYSTAIVIKGIPVKEGYTFSGWSEVPETMPARDVVVYGTFTVNSYNLIYQVDGVEYKRVSVVYGAPITLEAEPTKEGHTFSGWSDVPETMPAHNVVVEGSFTINKYLLTYMVEGNVFATDSITFGAPIELIEGPEKEGYTFAWEQAPTTMPAHDVVVNGVFTINSYDVIYMVDGAEYKRVSVVYGEPITLEAEPTKEGHTFSGWNDVPETMPAHNVVVEGSFTINKYLLTYMVEGNVFATDSITFGAPIELIEGPEKEGYTFAWEQVPATMPAYDVVVNGVFTINGYDVIYMVDGAEYKRVSVVYGEPITLEAEPTKEGHTFSGWSDVPETMPAHDVVVEGSFSVNYYALTYTVDNEWYATDSIAYGDVIKLREEPTKEGYVFSGWSEVPETMPAHDVEVQGTFTLFTLVDNVTGNGDDNVQKIVKENQFFILRDGKIYNAMGQEM